MAVRVGTSGYSYTEWKGNFFPADLPSSRMLEFYAQKLSTVEINNTFYRMPTGAALAHWAEQVPERFVFALEAPRGKNAALCIADTDEQETQLVPTAPWGYLRLRRTDYSRDALDAWAERVVKQWQQAFVYFKHEDKGQGPKFAAEFEVAVKRLAPTT